MDTLDIEMLGNEELSFDQLLGNNFPDNFTFEQELEKNAQNFEKILFGTDQDDENDSNIHGVLTAEEAEKILGAMEVDKGNDENPVLIQCCHCDEVFTNECFGQHVCHFTANKEKIIGEFIQEDPGENAFQKLRRCTLEMMDSNQCQIRKLLNINNPPSAQQSKDDKAKQSNHECFVCMRKFVHESGLYRHYDKHIGEILDKSPCKADELHPVILCAFCGEVFTMEQDVWAHLQKVHLEVNRKETLLKFNENEMQFEVKNAEEKSPSDQEVPQKTSEDPEKEKPALDLNQIRVEARNFPIEKFVQTIFVKNLFHCEYCSSLFANSKSLLLHVSKHEPTSCFHCSYCDIRGLSLKDLLIHRHDECVYYKDYRNTILKIPCVWVCNTCGLEFQGVEQLILHRHESFHFFPRMDHKNNQLLFACELCSTTYDSAPNLVAHLSEKHFKKPRATSAPETSTRVVKSPSSTRRGGGHQTSSRPRQYLCEICGKSYTQSSHLWQHLRFHQGIKPFECPHEGCGRKFTIRPDLNDHIRKCHTGERPYECTICGKRFLTGSVYYQHRLIHRGERRYGCEECGKRFYRADALKNHQLIHTGQKPYKCWVEGCTKSFRQRGDRDKHVKARHKNAPPLPSPPKKRMKVQSFGRGRTKNNTSLYSAKPSPYDMI